MDVPPSCSEGPRHELASEGTFTGSESSSVVQVTPSHTQGPLGSLEGSDKRYAIRGALHALRGPSADSKVRGPLGSSEGPCYAESPCHAPRGSLPRAQRTTGYLRGPFGSDRSEGRCQVLKGTLDCSGAPSLAQKAPTKRSEDHSKPQGPFGFGGSEGSVPHSEAPR